MQQRTKRLLMIWVGVIANICAYILLGVGAGWAVRQLPTNFAIAAVIVAVVGYAGWITFQIAKLRLEKKEYTEARVLRELRKGYDE